MTSDRHQRGAFFTPPHLAVGLAGWAVRSSSDRILDPGAGDGALLVAALTQFNRLGAQPGTEQLAGIEIDPPTAQLARSRLHHLGVTAHIQSVDLFCTSRRRMGVFDAIIMNPPWVRHRHSAIDQRQVALAAAKAQGVVINQRASLWAPFLVHAVSLLAPHGRLAAVMPAEILHADYAQPVRDFLLERFRSVYFAVPPVRAFSEAQVDPVMLFADNSEDPCGRAHVQSALERAGVTAQLVAKIPNQQYLGRRWSSLRMPNAVVSAIAQLQGALSVKPLGAVAQIRIGVVTGANRYFLMSPALVATHRIPRSARSPAIVTLRGVSGIDFQRRDWLSLGRRGQPCWLFDYHEPPAGTRSRAVADYIRWGEAHEVHLAHKCRIRHPWYAIPATAPGDALLTYMAGTGPRLVVNSARVLGSNLIHQISFAPSAPSPSIVAASFLSTFTQITAELEGRSYGGGVLKLEPSDARRIPLVLPVRRYTTQLEAAFSGIDTLLRQGDLSRATSVVDNILLKGDLGLSEQAVQELGQWLRELRSRRLGHRDDVR